MTNPATKYHEFSAAFRTMFYGWSAQYMWIHDVLSHTERKANMAITMVAMDFRLPKIARVSEEVSFGASRSLQFYHMRIRMHDTSVGHHMHARICTGKHITQ